MEVYPRRINAAAEMMGVQLGECREERKRFGGGDRKVVYMARLQSAKTNTDGRSMQVLAEKVRGEGTIVSGARGVVRVVFCRYPDQVRLCHRLAHTERQCRGANATSLLSSFDHAQ